MPIAGAPIMVAGAAAAIVAGYTAWVLHRAIRGIDDGATLTAAFKV